MKLSERIKQLRQHADMTQPELAEKAGIEQSYLSKLENEKGSPSFEVISKLATAFDMEAITFIDSLDSDYISSNLSHIPEIASNIQTRRLHQQNKMRKAYIFSAWLIIFGIALSLLGNSSGIFSRNIYQYKSMGLIAPNEVNSHYKIFPIKELNETRPQSEIRVKANVARLDEQLVLISKYKGESFVEYYGKQRRYFQKIDEREIESPWPAFCLIFGVVSLISGCLYMGYVFRFLSVNENK